MAKAKIQEAPRPVVTKRLASRLRAAYAKVKDKRGWQAHAESQLIDDQYRIDEFDQDPERFAELYYPGHAVDSYPVQTTMERTREKLEHRQSRMPVYMQELLEAERLKFRVEEEVAAELASMRKDTPGRIDWPSEPWSLEKYRVESLRSFERDRKAHKRYVLKAEVQRREAEVKRKAKNEAEMREINARMEHKFSLMPPLRAAAGRAYWEALKAAFATSNLSFELVGALASGDEEAHKKIADEAIARFSRAAKVEDSASGMNDFEK